MGNQLKIKQITVGQYGSTYAIIGLTEDGSVYQYRHTQGGWVPIPMKVVSSSHAQPQRDRHDEEPF